VKKIDAHKYIVIFKFFNDLFLFASQGEFNPLRQVVQKVWEISFHEFLVYREFPDQVWVPALSVLRDGVDVILGILDKICTGYR
jgi:hypothetical protein